MEITDYELFEVPPRWLFLKVTTSDGTVGWGEPVVEGRAKTVRTAVEELMDNYLLGEDPTDIEDHWQAMYRGGPPRRPLRRVPLGGAPAGRSPGRRR